MKARNVTLSVVFVHVCARKFIPIFFLLGLLITHSSSKGQCVVSTVNWDNLDYYYNAGNGLSPYGFGSGMGAGTYVSTAAEKAQKFAIGADNYISFAVGANIATIGEVATHTGDVTVSGRAYTGEDIQYTPSVDGQTIVITFNNQVTNASFTLYDIDNLAVINVTAANAVPTAQTVTATTQGGSTLVVTGATGKTITASSVTNQANTANNGTVTLSVAGPVKTITITVTTRGGDPVFFLSDIWACTPGTGFPNNYHQLAGAPWSGPAGNQPAYFLATPDNDAVYMVDPATGRAKFLFMDAARDYVNSFAYDAIHHVLYYISENNSVDATNKQLKKYDFNTNTSSVVLADIQASLGIPIMNMGIESAGAAFYDSALYLGIEGGRFGSGGSTVYRESIVWRIDLNPVTQAPTVAYQVAAFPTYTNATNTSIHDWGDFLIKNGTLVNFNTARNGSNYSQSRYHHYDMTTGLMTTYTNPSTIQYSGQGGLNYNGEMYFLRDSVGRYNENGTMEAPNLFRRITVIPGSGPYANWVGGTGDASDPFRPKSDFGDAPLTYDGAGSPAVHDYDTLLTLGSNFDDEWNKTGSSALANSDGADEDALAVTPIFTHSQNGYDVFIRATNTTGAVARIAAWIDFNNNGTFEAGEGIVRTINSAAGLQNVQLSWTGMPTVPVGVTGVFMRIRIASNAALTASTPNGWFSNGEVEDYLVQVDDVLPVTLRDFSAKAVAAQVKINWSTTNEQDMKDFVVERSKDGVNWEAIATVEAKGSIAGTTYYNYQDEQPYIGNSYYRLQMRDKDGRVVISDAKKVSISTIVNGLRVSPNPFTDIILVKMTLLNKENVKLKLLSQSGNVVSSKNVNAQQGFNTIELTDVSKLPAGIYILEITTSGEVKREKILKK